MKDLYGWEEVSLRHKGKSMHEFKATKSYSEIFTQFLLVCSWSVVNLHLCITHKPLSKYI